MFFHLFIGDKGDKFYVIDSGSFEVRVVGLGKTDSNGGDVVHVYHSGPEQHPGFGELSLMYDKPRAASVIAITDGKLWALDRVTFKAVVIRSMNTRKGIIRTLRKVKILECLNFQQMQRLADILVEETFDEGTLTHSLTHLLSHLLILTHALRCEHHHARRAR